MINAFLALLIMGAILGVILAVASKKLHVEEDKRIDTVASMLPGYNCGACGYPGCAAMAESVISGDAKIASCRPAKKDDVEQIRNYLKETPGPDGTTMDI